MKIRCSVCILVCCTVIVGWASSAYADITDAVVKVFVASNPIDYYRPWQARGLSVGGGSGVIVEGNKILTNAHVVADQTFIQVKKNADSKKYTAKVEAIGHDCDLALLSVNDADFFKGVKPVVLGNLPKLQESVTVLGYPQGGDKISITEGVVSRIEVTSYSQSARQLLTIQIDAAINPGNSGGPVLLNGKLVGVAMQTLQKSQSIGYTIPVPIIKHFLDDVIDGNYDGFPMIGIEYDTTENPTLRRYYKIDDKEGGVIITRILPFSSAEGSLQEGDAILKIDGVLIGVDGTFEFRNKERLEMPYLITKDQIGEAIEFDISRDGEKQRISLTLNAFKPLVASPHYYKKPTYYIFGGLVFTVLSTDLLKSWGQKWWSSSPMKLGYHLVGTGRLNEAENRDLVVMLTVLSDDINVGYHGYSNEIVRSVNGEGFNSFKDFVMLLKKIKSTEEFSVIETEQRARLILDNKDIDKETQKIMKRNNIPQQYSTDVANWLKEPMK